MLSTSFTRSLLCELIVPVSPTADSMWNMVPLVTATVAVTSAKARMILRPIFKLSPNIAILA